MRKRTIEIALVILALGLIGIGLSTLYQQNNGVDIPVMRFTYKVSYGFPLSWYGYSQIVEWAPIFQPEIHPEIYWFSVGSLLLDASFWFAISFFVSLAAIKTARALNLVAIARAGVLGAKTSITLLAMSLLSIVIGVGLCLVARSYLDLGLRLSGSGTVVLISTLLVMIWEAEQRHRVVSKERLIN